MTVQYPSDIPVACIRFKAKKLTNVNIREAAKEKSNKQKDSNGNTQPNNN